MTPEAVSAASLVFLITASKLVSARRHRRRSVFFLKRNSFAESQGVIATPRSDWSLPPRWLVRYQESPERTEETGLALANRVVSGRGERALDWRARARTRKSHTIGWMLCPELHVRVLYGAC